MTRVSRELKAWIVSRTGLQDAWRYWMAAKVPARLNWSYTLGGLTLFLFATQVITGVVLAFYYAPTPQAAYPSVVYLQDRVFLGMWLRALHYWGTTFMVVAALLHMARVFWYGSFKAPREATWMTGMLLLLLVLFFAFTGYLLPWDQKAYWGTVVGTNIAGLIPGWGKYVRDLLRGGAEVGALTLSRFYALHILLLPGVTALLVGSHLWLMRRHGIAPPPGRTDRTEEDFFPRQATRDLAVVSVALLTLLVLAWLHPAPLEYPADPNASGNDPKPPWYFLALYELLRYFPGRMEAVGGIFIPGLLILLLLAVPFLDRSPERRAAARPVALSLAAVLTLGLGALTFIGARRGEGSGPLEPGVAEIAGAHFFGTQCAPCHQFEEVDTAPPDFWVRQHAREKNLPLTGSERLSLVVSHTIASYLKRRSQLDLPAAQLRGAGLYALQECSQCHTVFQSPGSGQLSLRGVGSKRDKSWMMQHFKDPKKLSPGSTMPAYEFLSDRDLGDVSDFLLSDSASPR